MKKLIKTLLIIAVILGLVYGGYWIYKKFWGDKIEEMDADEGWQKYSEARGASINRGEYWVKYTIDNDRTENDLSYTTSITADNYGSYKKISGDISGSEYAIDIGNGEYALFTDINGEMSSEKISSGQYNARGVKLNTVEYLDFIGIGSLSDAEVNIKNSYYSDIVEDNEFKHIFGTRDGKYIWRVEYTCKYTGDDGIVYYSTFVRDIVFDSLIREVEISIVDKETNAEGEVVKRGKKKTLDIVHEIDYKTNNSLVKVDFSDFPAL